MTRATLEANVVSFAGDENERRVHIANVVRRLAKAALKLQAAIAEGDAAMGTVGPAGRVNGGGDAQHALDVFADDLFMEAAREAGIAHYASEERHAAQAIATGGHLALAVDPLDGSSNIDTNLTIGTIFSILPALETPERSFQQTGRVQLAAGFFIYGPQLALVLTLGHGTQVFTFSRRLGTFIEAGAALVMPRRSTVFAINMSNYRHWDEEVRLYVDDCLKGTDGAFERDFNMRWNASMVAEAFRILRQGGIYLYPRDGRHGYHAGRLRLVYEANPIALLMEQAGGAATNGTDPILDLVPASLHARVPLVFGSADDVGAVARYHQAPSAIGHRHPLFGQRGLFRT